MTAHSPKRSFAWKKDWIQTAYVPGGSDAVRRATTSVGE
jgi:hypothetical protein